MKRSVKIVHWTPRVICILAILFVSIFAMDAFSPGLSVWRQIGNFLIHLVPSYVILIILIVAWKWELAGGIIMTVFAVGFTPGLFIMNYRMNHSVMISIGIIMSITFPFILAGVLFIFSHYLKKKALNIEDKTGKKD